MFAYCRNNSVCRKDVTGTTDAEIFDDDSNPLDDDEVIAGGKMGGVSSTSGKGISGGNNSGQNNVDSSGSTNGGSNTSTQVIGAGHGNPLHKTRIDNFIEKLRSSGQYLKIFGNRSLKTAGLEGNQRPDVIAFGVDGQVEVWEFASPSQAIGTTGYSALLMKIGVMQTANPSVVFHSIIHW